jgi:hypothetical protein
MRAASVAESRRQRSEMNGRAWQQQRPSEI